MDNIGLISIFALAKSGILLSGQTKRPPDKSAMPDEKPVTDPETIAAHVRIARIVYGFDDDQHGPGEIDNPPTVVETLEGPKVRAWLPAAALSSDDDIELDERRAVKTTPSGEIVARVWLPVSHDIVRRRRR